MNTQTNINNLNVLASTADIQRIEKFLRWHVIVLGNIMIDEIWSGEDWKASSRDTYFGCP